MKRILAISANHITGNELTILSVYQSSKLISFGHRECPLYWIGSSPSELYHPDGRYRVNAVEKL
jgi:hypothetical protein